MKKVDLICLIVAGTLFAGVTICNLVQPHRPTESAMEQRTLQKMPAFSLRSLADGSYFSDLALFVSDTFVGREALTGVSKKLDSLTGVTYTVDGADSFAMLSSQSGGTDRSEAEKEADKSLEDAFARLDAETQNTADPASESETDVPETDAPDANAETETDPAAESETNVPETDAPETSAPETTSGTTSPTEAETKANAESETKAETDDPAVTVVQEIHLSRTTLQLTIGSGSVVYATVKTNTGEGTNVRWSVSDSKIASIVKNPGGGIDVKGLTEGTCTVFCRSDNGIRSECKVTVSAVTGVGANNDNATADFLTDGMFLYGDAVYTPAYFSEKYAGYYLQTAAYYKSLFGKDTTVSVVVSPVSAMVIDNASVKAKIPDQGKIMDDMAALADPSINFVDTYSEMYAHRNEYLFFKSDHHWTARGAYYAYRAFAASRDLTPTELDDFDYKIINDNYHGSMYSFTGDARVKNFTDTIEAFVTRKKVTMTITGQNGATYTYHSPIVESNRTYVTFIAGDNPYTVINVPENPQDKNVLVLKDSFGNAFVPYLCEHFGNIIVVDTRYTTMNIYEQLKDYGLTDIIFVNNVQAANSYAWSKKYLAAVGVE